jgi:O-antigen ligase
MSSTAPAADSASPAMSEGRSTRWFTPARLLRISLWVTGLMWVLPFLVAGKLPPVPSFHAEMTAAVLGLVAMSALPAFVGRLELPRVALLPLGLAGLIVIQMLLGLLAYRQVGLLASLYLLWAVGLVVLGGLFRRELGVERVASTLSWFLFAGALASALIGWAQHIDSDALERVMMPRAPLRVWANLGQSNHLADYLALGLVSVAYLYTTGRLRLRWVVPATLALAYILSLTGSRASWLYLVVLVALSAGFWAFDRSAANRRLLVFCAGALVALIVLPWLVGLAPTTTDPGDSVYERPFEERPRIWHAALLMFLDSPALGIGFRQFGGHHFVLNGQMPEPRIIGFVDHAHNLPLHVLTEFGLVGFALLAGFAVLWIAGQVRQRRTPATWWIWAIALVVMMHSMFEYPLWYTFFLGLTALVLGLGEPRTVKLQLGRQGRAARLIVLGLLAMGWLVTVQLFRDYLLLENFLAFRYRYIHATAEVNSRAKELLLDIHRTSLLAPYVELGLARTITVDADHLQDKLAVNGRAMQLFPIDDVAYRQAMLLALNGDQASAQRQWSLAVASFPKDRDSALLVVRRRVEDGLSDLRPLLDYAQQADMPRAN